MSELVQAGNEARTLLLEREAQRMRSELAALREGRNIVVPLKLSPLERCSAAPNIARAPPVLPSMCRLNILRCMPVEVPVCFVGCRVACGVHPGLFLCPVQS